MDALDCSTDSAAGSMSRLHHDLLADVGRLNHGAQKALTELLDVQHDIEAALRSAIARDPRTHYAIAKLAGVTPDVLDRFAREERGLNLTTAAKVAHVLGLRLVSGKRPVK